jgi:hypothetical protein
VSGGSCADDRGERRAGDGVGPYVALATPADSNGATSVEGWAHLPSRPRLSDGLVGGHSIAALGAPLSSPSARLAGTASEHGGAPTWTAASAIPRADTERAARWAASSPGQPLRAQLLHNGTLAVIGGYGERERVLYSLGPSAPIQSSLEPVLSLRPSGALTLAAVGQRAVERRFEPGSVQPVWEVDGSVPATRAAELRRAGIQGCVGYVLVLNPADALLSVLCAELRAASDDQAASGGSDTAKADKIGGGSTREPDRIALLWTGIRDGQQLLLEGALDSAGSAPRTLCSPGASVVLAVSNQGQLCSYDADEYGDRCARGAAGHPTLCARPIACAPRVPSVRGAYHARLGDPLAWGASEAIGARWAPRLCVWSGPAVAPRGKVWCQPQVCDDGSAPPCKKARDLGHDSATLTALLAGQPQPVDDEERFLIARHLAIARAARSFHLAVGDDGHFSVARTSAAGGPSVAGGQEPTLWSSSQGTPDDWLLRPASGKEVASVVPAASASALRGGQALPMGGELISPSGRYVAKLNRSQLCVFDLETAEAGQVRWCSMHPSRVLSAAGNPMRKFERRDCQRVSYAPDGTAAPVSKRGCGAGSSSLWTGSERWDDLHEDAPQPPVLTLALESIDTYDSRRSFSVGLRLRGADDLVHTVDMCVRHLPDLLLQPSALKQSPVAFRWCALLTVEGALPWDAPRKLTEQEAELFRQASLYAPNVDDVVEDGEFERIDFPRERDPASFSAVMSDAGCLELRQNARPPTALYHIWWSSCNAPPREPPRRDTDTQPHGWSPERVSVWVRTQHRVATPWPIKKRGVLGRLMSLVWICVGLAVSPR